MLRFWTRHGLIVLLIFIVASCSGGGCSSGCSSCGVSPLPAGFPAANTVQGAGDVRVTRPGLDFLQTNLGAVAGKLIGSGGTLDFDVPTTNDPATGSCFPYNFGATLCPNGAMPNTTPPQCEAQINIAGAKLALDSVPGDPFSSPAVTQPSIRISGTIPVQLQDLPTNISVSILCIPASGSPNIGIGNPVNGNGCDSNNNPTVTYADIPVTIDLPLVAETIAPRTGYTKIDAANAAVSVSIDSSIVQICGGGFIGTAANALKSTVVSQFTTPLVNQIKSTLQSELCTKVNPMVTPSCPDGSQPDSNNVDCVYTSDTSTCLPTMLGTDGHMDLGKLLASISPGTSGGLDFVLAANGAMNPAPGGALPSATGHTTNGMTLGLMGGTLEQPATTCVPIAMNPPPTGIPVPDEMVTDTISPWPTGDNGPDLGIALAGRFLDYALVSLYNSGVLCLGIGTDQIQELNSGYLSLVIPSLKKLTFESKPASAAITTRPQAPPTVTLGGGTDINTDPLLLVQLPQFAIDFYIWSYDRFVRVFTFTSDVGVPVNLSTAVDPTTNPNGGLLPVIGNLVINNPKLSNSELITDNPTTVAGALQGLLGGLVGQLIGGKLSPINLSSALSSYGIGLTIPADGIRKLHKDNDDFLGIFADLSLSPAMGRIVIGGKIEGMTIHPEAMALNTAERSKFPTLQLALSSPNDDGSHAIEYSWWIDQGTRSAWSQEKQPVVDNDAMILQGKHVLNVAGRYVGQPSSESLPIALPYTIDTLAPEVSLSTSSTGALNVSAWDLVSDDSALVARYRVSRTASDVGTWTDWAPLSSVTGNDFAGNYSVDVEVKDEMGNVGTTSNQLITGRPDPTLTPPGSGCSCSTPGTGAGAVGWGGWGGAVVFVLGLVALRLRKRGAGSAVGAGLALTAIAGGAALNQGCACGSNGATTAASDGGPKPSKTGCGSDCNQPCGPADAVGLIGAYTSVAKATDGSIWVAGYNDADINGGYFWGDLVVGKYDAGKQQVDWSTVDGLPPPRTDGSCPPNDPTGWRGGETDPGDDVGYWTSIALQANQNPMVSYYDATHQALKFASFDGKSWVSHTVKQAAMSDIGRYSKMIVVSGNPVIAFLVMEPGTGGNMTSKVTLAKANVAVPASASDWTFEDAAVDTDGPCRSEFCPADQVCISASGQCQATVTGCTPNPCPAGGVGTAGEACVTLDGGPTCSTVIDSTYIDSFPNAYADYISLANGPQGLGIVIYDRLHGNLVQVVKTNGAWTSTILDGETGSRANGTAVDTGDVGEAASLTIAGNGDWHISYGNGFNESMQYMLVTGGTMPNPREVVDDGTGNALGAAYTDGNHIVSEDSNISIDENGVVTIAYQDSTAGTLLVANGSPTGTTHKWSVKAITQANKFAGFFPQAVPGSSQLTNWWRETQSMPVNVQGNVAFITP